MRAPINATTYLCIGPPLLGSRGKGAGQNTSCARQVSIDELCVGEIQLGYRMGPRIEKPYVAVGLPREFYDAIAEAPEPIHDALNFGDRDAAEVVKLHRDLIERPREIVGHGIEHGNFGALDVYFQQIDV